MNNSSRFAAISAGISVGLTAVSPATAQEQDDPSSTRTRVVQEVTVTGSRIAETNLEAPTPVTVMSAEEIRASGVTSVGDVLNDLPALRGTFTSANSTRFIGTAGVNFLDLRGLGTERTLVLVNGRRHVSGTDASLQVDTNSIPADLLERVDIVTGGASSIFGSDAVAGVVNFVLKQDFEGLAANVQTGLSSRGDNQTSVVSLTAGRNFLDDRANLAASFEWAQEDAFQNADRPTTRNRGVFVVTSRDPAGSNGDGIADRNFFENVRSVNLGEGGVFIPSFQPGVTAESVPLELRVRPENGQPRIFNFSSDGTLAELDYGLRDFRPLAANSVGGGGTTLRRYGDLTPDIERASVNLLGHMDFTDTVQLFGEAKYVRVDVLGLFSPSFNQTVSASSPADTGSGALVINLDNPYLTNQALSIIQPLLPDGAGSFNLNRNNLDLGIRGEDTSRETSRIVAGLRGDLTANLTYEASLNYGETRVHTNVVGNRFERQLRLSVDAVRAANGEIVCRSRLNDAGVVVATGDPVVDNCVPVNLLGEGNVTEAARAYITAPSTFDATIRQQVANGFVSYDTGAWFELPGGPVGMAVGAEYRKESSAAGYSEDVSAGLTFLNSIQSIDESYSVKEAFAELRLPLLADLPGVQELTLNGSYRAADYTLRNTGTITAWNGGIQWTPIEGLRFRANLSQSVRTPTIGDLFQPLTQNFANVDDPCDANFISQGSATRAANCAAAGIPAGFINSVARAQTIEIRSGGNPDLTEEESRSWTIGAVVQPRWLPGLDVTVDYYDIEITDVIDSVTAQQILDNCYDAASLDNIFCPLVFRDPQTSLFFSGGNGPVGGGVLQSTLNYAARKARGIDAELAYRINWEGVGDFRSRLIGTYVLQRDDFPFLDEPDRPDQLLEELGDPKLALTFRLGYTRGPLSIDYGMRWLDTQYIDFIENVRSVGGRPPTNPDYSDIGWTGSIAYHDIRFGYAFRDNLDAYLGVDNIGDELPPLGFTGNGGQSSVYSNTGQFFYGGVKWRL